jgi:hypothetical protein
MELEKSKLVSSIYSVRINFLLKNLSLQESGQGAVFRVAKSLSGTADVFLIMR